MKKLLLSLTLLTFTSLSWGQMFSPSASEVTEEEAQELFKILKVENEKMSEDSECFERAHMWSRAADRIHAIDTEKVFTFFTKKFKMKHQLTRWGKPLIWWFHVAPAVRVNGELWVLDATFTDKAMPVQDWAKSLMQDPSECVELNDFLTYVADRNITQGYRYPERAQEQCYYTATPRFIYGPMEMGVKETKNGMVYEPGDNISTSWNNTSLKWALKSYKSKYRKAARRELDI